MLLLLLILVCSFFISTILFYDANKGKKKKRERFDRNNRYKMPPIFWDEYNWLSLKVYSMQLQDCDNVRVKIDQFIYKYEQFVDLQVFNDRVGILLNDYQRRVKHLQNNKN